MSSITAGTTSTTTLVHSGDTTGSLVFKTNDTGSGGTTAVTIDTSQNVGIGGTPAQKLDVIGSGSRTRWNVNNSYVYQVISNPADSAYAENRVDALQHTWYVSNSERMRIDSSSNLLVGRTSTVTNPASSGAIVYASSGYSTTDGTTTANYTKDRIYFNATNYYVLNGSSTGVVLPSGNTSWSAQSDERTKDIIEPIQNATQKLSDFRCVIGKYKTDDSNKRRVFLIAQDVQKVLPEAVTELDDENKTLALSYTDVIPLLVASIQELKAINDQQAETINALTARVVALEAK